jgi:hypothetical protein
MVVMGMITSKVQPIEDQKKLLQESLEKRESF